MKRETFTDMLDSDDFAKRMLRFIKQREIINALLAGSILLVFSAFLALFWWLIDPLAGVIAGMASMFAFIAIGEQLKFDDKIDDWIWKRIRK